MGNLKRVFQLHFGRLPRVVVTAPGRVNLIGEHTDYNQGYVLPAAINFATRVVAAARNDRNVNVIAMDYGNKRNCFRLDDIPFDQSDRWSNYVRGVLRALQKHHAIGGADLLITGNVPQGAGLSSSASLEIAVLKAFSDLYQLELDGIAAALLGQQAENEFVGCACGIMDQLVSAMGRDRHALLLDCQSLAFRTTPIPPDYQLVIVNSNIRRGLVGGEYNARRQQCEQAATVMGVASLRQVDLAMLRYHQKSMTDTIYRRAHHVVTENQRTLDLFAALESGQNQRIAELMWRSHQSMRDDFEITVPPVDHLVELIQAVLGEQGGARMTGGGFGGCVVVLAPQDAVSAILDAVERQYQPGAGIGATVYICTAEKGAFV